MENIIARAKITIQVLINCVDYGHNWKLFFIIRINPTVINVCK